jgi:hypothetical protein
MPINPQRLPYGVGRFALSGAVSNLPANIEVDLGSADPDGVNMTAHRSRCGRGRGEDWAERHQAFECLVPKRSKPASTGPLGAQL